MTNKQDPVKQPGRKNTKRVSDKDRMLAALKAAPRLPEGEAEKIRRAVLEAREASIVDQLSA